MGSSNVVLYGEWRFQSYGLRGRVVRVCDYMCVCTVCVCPCVCLRVCAHVHMHVHAYVPVLQSNVERPRGGRKNVLYANVKEMHRHTFSQRKEGGQVGGGLTSPNTEKERESECVWVCLISSVERELLLLCRPHSEELGKRSEKQREMICIY